MNGRRIAACAVLALLAATAVRAEGVSEVIPAAADAPEYLLARRVTEKLGLPAPSALSTADLDNDGYPELLVLGDGGARILRLDDKGWSDISGGALRSVAGLGDIAVEPLRFNGYPVLVVGDTRLALHGGAYKPLDSIVPVTFDASAFTPACEGNETMAFFHEENDAPAADVPSFCKCLLDEWQARGLPQTVFDAYTRELQGVFNEGDRDERGEADTLIGTADEALYACKTARGWTAELPYPFGQPMFDGKARPAGAAELLDSCSAQDWVAGNSKIGSADRALGFCGCLTGNLALSGMSDAGFRMVAGLYNGDLSENDVRERDPMAIEASDLGSEACIQSMPYR